MSITVSVIGGRYAPMVLCDTCGKALTNPGMAVVAYDLRGEGDREPIMAHKGACHEVVDKRIRDEGGFPGWSELGTWIANLLHNAGLDDDELARAQDSAALFAELGI